MQPSNRPVDARDPGGRSRRHGPGARVDRPRDRSGPFAPFRDDAGRLDRARIRGYARLLAVWAVAGPAVAVGVLFGIAALAPAVGAIAAPAVALVAWIGLVLLTGPNGRAKFHGETAYHRRARLALFAAGVAVGASALVVALA